MKKSSFIIIMMLLMTLFVPSAFAHFTQSHLYWTYLGLEEVDSPVTQLCRDKASIVLDGNTGADVFVLYYFEDRFISYVSTHTRGSGYQRCLELAGSDPELQCLCIGIGTHIVQDSFSHLKGGLVPTYLQKFWAANLIGHMAVENDFEKKHVEILKENNDYVVTSGKLAEYNSIVLDNYFPNSPECPECNGDRKFAEALIATSGLPEESVFASMNIFRNGYQGKGFFETVYDKKVSLPIWFFYVSISMIVIGLMFAFVFYYFGKNSWKWLAVAFYLFIFLTGGLILASYPTNNTWKWTKGTLSALTSVGILSVDQADVVSYNEKIKEATFEFLRCENTDENGNCRLPVSDASGLSYCNEATLNGVCLDKREGDINNAESRFKYILLPIIGMLFALFNAFIIKKSIFVR